MPDRYQLIVIGAGPGGYVAAICAAQRGLRTAVIEKDKIGGTCLNRGCIPTKTLLKTSALLREMKECEKFGITAAAPAVDMTAVYARRDAVVAQLRGGVASLLSANKVDVIAGEAKILRPGEVQVRGEAGELTLFADDILIAAGSAAAVPPIEGIGLPGVVTSNELLTENLPLPERLLIIGGGVIGVEFACAFSDFGARVIIVEAKERLLPGLDREIAQNTGMLLKKRGISVYTGASVEKIRPKDGLTCVFSQKGQTREEAADQILVAVGRRCDATALFAPDMTPQIVRGQLAVDERFETSISHIFAVGDIVSGGMQLAHAASAQAERAVGTICGDAPPDAPPVIPSCVYTDPEIACIGLGEDEAKAQGIGVFCGKALMSANAKHVIDGGERGYIKLVFEEKTEVLLGAQLFCPRATDMIGELAAAVTNRLTRAQLEKTVRPHPTFCEAVTEAAMAAAGHAVHAMPVKKRG